MAKHDRYSACVFTLFSVVFVFLNLHCVAAKYVEGHLKTLENWAFLARFCFLSEEGQFEYVLEYEKDYGTQNILLYYDSETQWPAVYKSNKTCDQKETVLSVGKNQIINLTTTTHYLSGCDLRNRSSDGTKQVYVCHNVRKFRSARERWWFIAISNCNTSKGLNLKYKLLMTNGPPGDYWREHFSADEFYILPILMGMCLIYLLLILAIIMCTVELKARQLLHSTYKMFLFSVVFQEVGIMFQSISYIRYAVNGTGFPRTKNFGRFLESISEIIYLLLLLLLAKGYTVTRGRLRLASSIKLTIFMCLYVVTYACIFWYETQFFDPGLVLYIYESPPGYGLLGLRMIAWWMFVYSTIFTLKHYPEKSKFYYSFNIIGTLWFVSGPSFILAANGLIDKWVRESVVCGVLHFIALSGHILFLVLTLPSHANKNFPYHVRTTQIGCLDSTLDLDPTAGSFGHHAYAVSATHGGGGPRPIVGDWISDVPVELFSISRSVHMSYGPRAPPMSPSPMPPPPKDEVGSQLAIRSGRAEGAEPTHHQPQVPTDLFRAPSQMTKEEAREA